MINEYPKIARTLLASLFALLLLYAGTASGATPSALEPGQQEVVLKVENMT